MKTLIAVPCMDQVAAGFAGSLALLRKPGITALYMLCGSLIYDSRNKLVKHALEKEMDYVFWLDSDMTFEPDVLERMIKHMEDGKDIVTGLYFRRALPFTPVIFKTFEKRPEGGFTWTDYKDYPKDEPFEVAACGGGCLMVRTSVFMDMMLNYRTWFDPLEGAGEDMAFCLRARELGYKIWCDPSIKLGHVGNLVVTEDVYESLRKD